MLDTNIVSGLIRNPGGRAAQRATRAGDTVCISISVAAELRYGYAKKASPHLLRRVGEFLFEVPVLPFGVPADSAYGAIRADLEAAGRPIGSNDLLVAACPQPGRNRGDGEHLRVPVCYRVEAGELDGVSAGEGKTVGCKGARMLPQGYTDCDSRMMHAPWLRCRTISSLPG